VVNLVYKVQEEIAAGLKNLFDIAVSAEQLKIENTISDYEGDYTFVVFPFVKQARKSPEQTAQALGEFLVDRHTVIEKFNVVKGFLNLVLRNELLTTFFNEAKDDPSFLLNSNGSKRKIMVEYSSPNTNKPLHLGHVRNNLLGYSISEILKSNGYDVFKANLVNDRGIHICKSMLAWKESGMDETPQSSGMKGDHLVGKYYVLFDKKNKEEALELVSQGTPKEEAEKNTPSLKKAQEMLRLWEAGDEETVKLWRTMNSWVYAGFDLTYKRMGVDFNKFYYESETYLLGKKTIQEGLEKGVFYKKDDGSVWVDLTADGLDNKLLLRSDGTSVYITQDIGTAELKYHDFPYEKSLYVVGNEQDYHFKVLSLILKKLNKPYANAIHHVSYGMVDLPTGKMKSREGTVVDGDDLMNDMNREARQIILERGKTEGMTEKQVEELCEEVGMAGLKYFLLRVDPQKRMLFNPKESIDLEGNTGPYIQYTNARINSVLAKNPLKENSLAGDITLNQHERDLLLWLYQYKDALAKAAASYSPAELAMYTYELARLFNRFYYECPIAKEGIADNLKNFRLQLSKLTGSVITEGLRLLGIKAPGKM
jgi:arginyl-tRNA synthetase